MSFNEKKIQENAAERNPTKFGAATYDMKRRREEFIEGARIGYEMAMSENSERSKSSLDTTSVLECQDCGLATPDVKETLCPFAYEIYYEEVPVVLCDHCIHERAMNI